MTKDPYLYGSGIDGALTDVVLGRAGRSINERAAQYPFVILDRFARRFSKNISDLSVLLVGLAFKGVPETTDMRGSASNWNPQTSSKILVLMSFYGTR